MSNLRYALRTLVKQPAFAIIAILTLALGIGANTAIFSVINAVLLRPLPYPDADRIVYLNETNSTQSSFALSLPDYVDLERDNTVFEELALTRSESRNLSDVPGREPERIATAFVSANFFKVVGLAPQLGRTFTKDEDKPGAPRLVVLSDRLWTRVFQRDPNIVGRVINIHSQPHTVTGVMPPALTAPENPDVWLSLMRRSAIPGWQNRANHPMMFAWGRLKSGVGLDEARAQVKAISARLEQLYPETNDGISMVVTPLLDNMVGKYRTNLLLLCAAVGLVLLIACGNLANLFAARGAAREREFAIRAAVGASRGQIVRQLLIESLTIAIIGGGLGFLIALWSRDALIALGPQGAARFAETTFDWRVLAFTFGLGASTSLLFGLWPARQAARMDVQPALQAGSHGSSETRGARRLRDYLVIAEVALTLLLLTAAGLVLKSFARMQAHSLGFQPDKTLTARMDLSSLKYDTNEKALAFGNAVMTKARTLPGVQSVGLATNPPMLSGWQINFQVEGAAPTDPSQQPSADTDVVTGDYFQALGASLMRGRTFTSQDTKESPPVIIIDQTLAETAFPGIDPIGKRLFMATDNEGDRWYEIIGIVPRMKMRGYAETRLSPAVFFSQTQVQRENLVLLVRAGGSLQALERPLREIIASVDPTQAVFDVRSMSDRVAETWATHRLLTFLLGAFALLALLLATIGLYGVLAYTTAKRLREIAVRLALGARPSQVRGLILNHGLRLLVLGSLIGFAAVLACSRILQSFLFDVQSLDPGIYLIVGAVLFVATLLACWLPARRACRVDPIVALRSE